MAVRFRKLFLEHNLSWLFESCLEYDTSRCFLSWPALFSIPSSSCITVSLSCTFSPTAPLPACFSVSFTCFFGPSSDSLSTKNPSPPPVYRLFVLTVCLFRTRTSSAGSTPHGTNSGSYSEFELKISSSQDFTWFAALRVFALLASGHLFLHLMPLVFSTGRSLSVGSGVFVPQLRLPNSAFQLLRSF